MNLEIFILAGGKSSRMGQDKGTLFFKNQEMIKHSLDMLQNFDFPINIIANQDIYQKFGLPVFKDLVHEKGAMGGLYTALNYTKTDFVLLLPCDMPFLHPRSIFFLTEALQNSPKDCIISQINHKINPLLAIYKKSILEKIQHNIEKNKLKMKDFVLSLSHKIVDLTVLERENSLCFKNINTPNDLIL